MASSSATPPISYIRLKQIANDACQSALGSTEFYEHSKTEPWNTMIINSILRSLISESSPSGGSPSFKFAVNSTIIQHLVPTSALNKAKAAPELSSPPPEKDAAKVSTSDAKTEATGTDGKPHVGRRGMHSATGAYWNEKSDGMWSFKYEGGESKGLDVVINRRPYKLSTLDNLILVAIVQHLDFTSASALAQTNCRFREVCRQAGLTQASYQGQTGAAITGPLADSTSSSNMASVTFQDVGSLSSDDDSPGTAHTGITTPDEAEWSFKITPDLVRRLSLLPQRNNASALEKLPAELHLEVFKYLDKIDACCLGLASPVFYPIFREIHGTKMPLNTRRIGPNSLESAWEVVGKQVCQQCGLYRCELHQHIKTWMPDGLEYCAFKQNFGLAASEHANTTCYRGKPSKPKRCGRHPLRTTSVHQDDALAGLAMTPITQ
ncbi:hypothetical protein D0Z07_7759 [Hyphodiscus hymeniophilus]|uniref:F-box domain-containing protein n=1 Tax=Hyphodiscus hymeniophilus TaxID=353542 RepID=A0A9P6SLY5_9HELO|nr:hypothetical protein D0Z07_7759 [Hyphodiscus hymeniophilus]